VLVLGATDRRIACVVSQVPTTSGYQQGLRRVAPEGIATLEAALDEDERAQARGEPPRRQTVVNADTAVPASYRARDAIDFYLQPLAEGARWENTVMVRSTRLARMYEPGVWAPRVSPTPTSRTELPETHHSRRRLTTAKMTSTIMASAQASSLRNSRRMILPVDVFGKSLTNCTARGTLYAASSLRHRAIISSASAGAPGLSTT
jgi:hypothetical protein